MNKAERVKQEDGSFYSVETSNFCLLTSNSENTISLKQALNIGVILILLFFSYRMVELSLPYFGLDTNVAFLRIKQWVFRQHGGPVADIWITAFFIHVFTSIFALIAGFTQFFRQFLWKKVHRTMGAVYIITILFLSGPSGFIMGLLANGGIISIISFTLLSVLWWTFTLIAYRSVKEKNYERHAKFMYRSYALTLSALTLRLWKWFIVNYIDDEIPPMDLYRLVGWLGWVPNLLIAEILILKGRHLKMLKAPKSNE